MDENKAHYVVATGIIVKNGKYLITKRAEWEKAFPGKWTVPGGKLEVKDYINKQKDTTEHWYNILEILLKREVKEETGLIIKNIKYLTSMTFIRPDNVPVLVVSLYADYDFGEVELSKDMTDFAWVTLEEAKSYDLIEGIYEELAMLDNLLKEKKEDIGEWRKGLRLLDEVYGGEIVHEKVLIELINSKPVQRLKNLSQYGIPDKYYHKKNFSRFDHSIGVMLFLRKIGANLNEQIAGLLHDVSHTAFSHVVDWAIGDPTKEDFQDKNHLEIIEKSEIPYILEKYGFDYKEISITENFSLLEKEAPGLCADRIDYALRELNKDGEEVNKFVSNLISYNNQIVFKKENIAEEFAFKYLKMQNEHWAGKQARIRYYILSNILKRALDKKIIEFSELYKTDLEILDILEESYDEDILFNLNLLKNGLSIEENSSGILIKKKFRYIDPEILIDYEIKKLSDISETYANALKNEKINSEIEMRYIYHGISRDNRKIQ